MIRRLHSFSGPPLIAVHVSSVPYPQTVADLGVHSPESKRASIYLAWALGAGVSYRSAAIRTSLERRA